MDSPQISRSGRVLKKSAKVKEMEDFDINELDVQGKARKKLKSMDDYDEFDDKRVAPIKIPKISLNMQGGSRKRINDITSPIGKQIFKSSFQSPVKAKQDARRSIYQKNDSSDGSKESDSSTVSSESSSSSSPSSSEVSDDDEVPFNNEYKNERKVAFNSNLQSPVHHEKVIVERQPMQILSPMLLRRIENSNPKVVTQVFYESPLYMGPGSDETTEDSEDDASDSALVIAEDSDGTVDTFSSYSPKAQKVGPKKRTGKKDPTYAPKQGGAGGRKKPPAKATDTAASKKKKPAPKPKALSAYMLWCSENRKKIAASSGNIGFGNIGKKLGEAWQALPEKEKMAWRRKAKRLALKAPGNIINTGSNAAQNKTSNRAAASISEELLKGLTESTGLLGTAPIDAAAHLKLLGDSLTVIGQRLIEHEGQLAVSGIYSVLLDTLLCAIGPLLCLTTEITGLEHLSPDVFKKTLDHIAYFMPGL